MMTLWRLGAFIFFATLLLSASRSYGSPLGSCSITDISTTSVPVGGKTYRVSKSCDNGNPCTLAQVNALSLRPGDSVLFEAGTVWKVSASDRLRTKSGVTYSRYGDGPNPIIDGTGMALTWQGLVDVENNADVLIDGIDVRNSSVFGIMVTGGSNVTVRNLRIHSTDGGGVVAIRSSDVAINNIEVTSADGGPHESIAIIGVNGFVVSNVYSHNNGHAAINIKSGSKNGEVYNSEFTSTRDDPTFYVERAENIRIHHNYIHNNSSSPTKKALLQIGIEPFGDPPEQYRFNRHIEIHDNVIANAQRDGISMWIKENAYQGSLDGDKFTSRNMAFGNQDGPERLMDDIHIHDNVVISTGQEGETWQAAIRTADSRSNKDPSDWSNIVIENNIIWDTNSAPGIALNGIRATVRSNLFEIDETGETGSNAIFTSDPRFTDAKGADFSLELDSPAIGAGTNGGDIGADSFCGSSRPTPPTLLVTD